MKLHLPKLLLTAVLAVIAMPSALQAATYSVTMGSVGDDGNYFIDNSTYTDDATGTAASGFNAVAVASNGSGSEHILHFTSASGTVADAELKVNYNDFGIAGVDVDADTNVAKIGYKDGPRSFYIGRKGVTSASTVDRDFTFEANGSINLHGTQTWTVAAEKTFTFTGSSIINNADITISGDGSVDFSSKSVSGIGSIAVNGTLKNATFASGSTIGLNNGATLENVTLSDGSYVATTFEWGETSGKQTVTKTWDAGASTGFTAGTSVGLNIGGIKLAGTSSYENSTLTISTDVYNIAAADTVAVADISGVSGIVANGTLTGAADTTLSTSIPVIGTGIVQVNAILENKLDALAGFTGNVELVNGGKIHFGNNNSRLSNINKIKINSGAYITGWGAAFDYDILLNGGNLAVNTGSWTGDFELTADSSIGNYNGTTISGAITATAGTTLTVKKETTIGSGAADTITFNGTAGKLNGATLDIQYGTVKINGRSGGTGMIAGSIKIGADAKLQVAGTDTLGYAGPWGGNYTDALTAEGTEGKLAKIQFDATQTLSTNLNLNGYTEVSGSSFSGFGGKVTVSGTNNTIKNEYKMRDAITFEVNGSLTMEGAITNFDATGVLTKTGTGDMTISGTIDTNHGIKVAGGELKLTGSTTDIEASLEAETGKITYGAGTHSVKTLDIASGGDATATVSLNDGAALAAETLWLRSAGKLELKKGATLTLAGGVVSIKGTADGTNNVTSGVASSHTSGAKYAMNGVEGTTDSSAFTISNADVSVDTTTEDKTINNVLAGSKLINGGENVLTATNAGNVLAAIDAKLGSVNVLNTQSQTLSELSIGAGKTVGIYSGASVPTAPTSADEATVTTSSLTVGGANATLNANLVLSDSATVTMDGALTMGSTLTLGTGMELNGALLTSVTGLTAGNTVDLFTGVDGLTLGSTSYDANTTLELGTETLSSYFGNVTNPDIYLGYDGQKVYAGVMQAPVTPAIPEPTTATLSLLALAALAARRRRR